MQMIFKTMELGENNKKVNIKKGRGLRTEPGVL